MNAEMTKQMIVEWNDTLQNTIKLDLIVNNTKKSDLFQSFCNDLSGSAPNVVVTTEKDGNATEPYIKINENLIFKAVPEAKLLKRFLELLSFDPIHVSKQVIENLKTFDVPVTLRLYISPFCPFCPQVVSDVSQLAFTDKQIKVVIIDGTLFTTLAEEDKITSAPTIVFNDNFRWTGSVNPEDIAEVIGNTKPEELSLSALTTLIETGKATTLAGLMIRQTSIFPAFYDLLTHEKWPLRLGAMVAMEEIIEKKPALAQNAIETLWENFSQYNDPVKGDIVYITGESGNPLFIDKISGIIDGDYSEELKEAATEAVESLQE